MASAVVDVVRYEVVRETDAQENEHEMQDRLAARRFGCFGSS